MTTEINLKGLYFFALVGILPLEREQPQRIEIDISVALGDGDDIVDYRALYAAASDVMHSGHIDYLEQIGERVARGVLAHSRRILVARVAVRKPTVSLGGPLDYAEVVVTLAADPAGA
jgi:dihydroneopterin aldolase